MNQHQYTDLLNNKPFLLKAILNFNEAYNKEIDNNAFDALFNSNTMQTSSFVAALNQNLRAKALLTSSNAYIQARETEPAKSFWNFGEESSRLILLDQPSLETLILTWGAAIVAPQLAKIILKDELLNIKKEIGSQLYHYAVSKGQYQLGSIRRVYIEALGGADSINLELIQQYGLMALSVCSADWEASLLAQLRLKLSGDFTEQVQLFSLDKLQLTPNTERYSTLQRSSTLQRFTWSWLKKILITEVAPTWRHCFD